MSPMRSTVQVVGRRMDAEHYRLRDFLTRTAQPYEWHEADTPEADQLLQRLGLTDAELPVLVDGRQRLLAGDRGDGRDSLGRFPTAQARALRLRRHRRRPRRPGGRRLCRLGRPFDARVRPRRARRPGVERDDDRELLRLPGRDRRRRAGAARRQAGGTLRRRADAPARRPGEPDERPRRARRLDSRGRFRGDRVGGVGSAGHGLAAARPRRDRRTHGQRRLLRSRSQRGGPVRGPARGRGRGRQLGGPGRPELREPDSPRDDARARRPAQQDACRRT